MLHNLKLLASIHGIKIELCYIIRKYAQKSAQVGKFVQKKVHGMFTNVDYVSASFSCDPEWIHIFSDTCYIGLTSIYDNF